MKPYTPFKTGVLESSAAVGTVIGSGEIHQNTPYAHYLYYGKVYGPNIPIYENGQVVGFFSKPNVRKQPTGRDLEYDKTFHPLAGPYWFKRMVADKQDILLQSVADTMGGSAE